jgi:hypothetical protein
MNQSNQFSLKGVADLSLCFSIGLLFLHFYYFGYPLFDHLGLTSGPSDRVLIHIVNTHLFDTLFGNQVVIVLFLGFFVLAIRGRKDLQGTLRGAIKVALGGLLLYFFSGFVYEAMGATAGTAVFYILLATVGWLGMLTGGIRIKRVLIRRSSALDPFDVRRKGFPQEEDRLTSQYSLHLRGQYALQGRIRNMWINLVNPRRGILIMGSSGSGKTRFIIEPLMYQWMERGRAIFVYDYKFEDLSRLTWQLFQYYSDRYPAGSMYYCINFKDLSRSHRCNVLDPSTLDRVSDALGAARTILLSMNKTWAGKQGEFFVESPINLLGAAIWWLREYQAGIYCTLPHVIELIQTPYPQLLSILQTVPETRSLVSSLVQSYVNKSTEMLDGIMASTVIPLGRLVSPDIYYILTGNQLVMDINDPGRPKVFCLGGDPRRKEALAPILSLFIEQVNRLCNQPKRYPCALVCDEFATVRAAGMLNTFATARSNDIVPVIVVQDISQLKLEYSDDEANAVVNISGNFFCGQAAGKTAEWVSQRFPKMLKDRESVSTNSSDTSINVAPQWEETVTPATISALSSGEFVGVVADDPRQELTLKAFHARILREQFPVLSGAGLPVVRTVDNETLKKHSQQIREEVRALVQEEFGKMTRDRIMGEWVLKPYE